MKTTCNFTHQTSPTKARAPPLKWTYNTIFIKQSINQNKINHMNTKLKTLLAIAVTIVALIFGLSVLPNESHAAGLSSGEQYKVFFDIGRDPTAMEEKLNTLAADGWRVRAATAQGFIILAK